MSVNAMTDTDNVLKVKGRTYGGRVITACQALTVSYS